jgi:serine-type D-Ala-D-Ala carboxypeptidase (penicillin-binding protein 5/6)
MFQVFLFFFLILTLITESKPLKINVSAQSALLINAETGAVLYEKDPHLPCHPASILKIATALYALEKKQESLDERLKVNSEMIYTVSPQIKKADPKKHPAYRLTTDGTMMGLKAGELISFKTLMYGLMLASGNDAANVIAEYVSGSIPQFMEELNAYLKKCGCEGTYFSNPSGLPDPEQVTTARDIARVTQMAMKHPFFQEVVKTVNYPRFEGQKEGNFLIHNNRLLKRGAYFYPKAIGVKTGFTNAGHNFVAAAKEGDRTLIAVLLYCGDAAQKFKDAIALFETAFAEKVITRLLLTQEHDRFSLSIRGAKIPLEAALAEDLKISYFPAEEPELKAFLHWHEVKIPITKGTRVGEIQLITQKGEIFKTAPLLASRDVEMTFFYSVQEFLKENKKAVLAISGISFLFILFYFLKGRRTYPQSTL